MQAITVRDRDAGIGGLSLTLIVHENSAIPREAIDRAA